MTRLSSFRWALLLVFLAGFLVTPLSQEDSAFVWLNLVSLLACALLLMRLQRPLTQTLWVWVILLVFIVGYFVKTFLIASDVTYWAYEASFFYELQAVLSLRMIAEGYPWITLAFVIFCVTSWWLLGARRWAKPPRFQDDRSEAVSINRLILVLTGATILSLGLAALRAALGMGIYGLEGSSAVTMLPFRLGTVIVRLQDNVLPAMQLLCIWAAERSGHRRLWLAGIGIIVLSALAMSVITTSRGALLLAALPLLFLWLLTHRLTRPRLLIVGVVLASLVLLFPFVSALRVARISGQTDFWGTMELAQESLVGNSFLGSASSTVVPIVFRVIGADGVWFALTDVPEGLSLEHFAGLLFDEPFTLYYTREIVGTTQPATYRSPGLVGAFMLLGGIPGVVVFSGTFVLVVKYLWEWLSRFQSAPVSLSLCALFLVGFASEGTLQVQSVIALIFNVLVCEWLYRNVLLIRRSSHDAQLHPLVATGET